MWVACPAAAGSGLVVGILAGDILAAGILAEGILAVDNLVEDSLAVDNPAADRPAQTGGSSLAEHEVVVESAEDISVADTARCCGRTFRSTDTERLTLRDSS